MTQSDNFRYLAQVGLHSMDSSAAWARAAACPSAHVTSTARPNLLAAARLVFSGEQLPCSSATASAARSRRNVL